MPAINDLLDSLREKNLTLGSVESLTGGLFGARICAVPGASDVYRGGLITYVASLKEKLAHVSENTIEENGVVSAEVVKEMAIGGKETLGVDICIACTGNAGPTVEKGQAPIGRVYLGLCYDGNVWTIPLDFAGERNEIREKTVSAMVSFIQSLFPLMPNEK